MNVGSRNLSSHEVDQANHKVFMPNNPTLPFNVTYMWTVEFNSKTIINGFYVLAAVTSIIVLYFVSKAVRLRKRNYKIRRYGLIASREDVEMTPLENEDDDEDSTVFDISVKNNLRS